MRTGGFPNVADQIAAPIRKQDNDLRLPDALQFGSAHAVIQRPRDEGQPEGEFPVRIRQIAILTNHWPCVVADRIVASKMPRAA
jgi:hypothetical protein